MEQGGRFEQYIVARGYVHGRGADSLPLNAAFLVISAVRPLLVRTCCSRESLENEDQSLAELLETLNAAPGADAEPELARYAAEFRNYLKHERLFGITEREPDEKQMERKITYFFSDALDVRAITFLQLTHVGADTLHALLPDVTWDEEQNATPDERVDARHAATEEDGKTSGGGGPEEVFLACEPLLDPVAGVAVEDLEVGDSIFCRLPRESAFFKLISGSNPDFDGSISGDISGIRLNETGSTTVALKLSEGVTGALKLSGRVKVKLCAKRGAVVPSALAIPPATVLLAVAGVALFLITMAILLYLFS